MLVDDANLGTKVSHDEQIRRVGRLLARLPGLLRFVPVCTSGSPLSPLLGAVGAVGSLVAAVGSLVGEMLGAAVGPVVDALVGQLRVRRIGSSQIVRS
jgi:hypothetical protein